MTKKSELEDVFDDAALKILDSEQLTIGEINPNFIKVNLTGKVIHLFEDTHASIALAGLIGDETGVVRFVVWPKQAKENALEEGKIYSLTNYKVNEYQGKVSIVTDTDSVAVESDKEITVQDTPSEAIDLKCFVVAVKKAAIVKVCDDPLGDCKKKSKWGFDVRLLLDSGQETVTVDVRDFELLDLTIAEVKKIVMESGNPNELNALMTEKLSGHYLTVTKEYDAQRYFLVRNKTLKEMKK